LSRTAHRSPLVVFDLDGTLCDTVGVDAECFVQACAEWLGDGARHVDWAAAPQVTDQGILEWMAVRLLSRPPSTDEARGVERRFLELLGDVRDREPARFRAVPGAAAMLDALAADGRGVTVATGGWRASALLKLRAAELPTRLLAASSSDSPDRVEIFRLAASRSSAGRPPAERVVLVGDGVWDVEIARALGWGFVGVGAGPRAARLRDAGAERIVPDFRDAPAVRDALDGG